MLGKRISDERQRLGMSLTEFAKRVGVHRNTQTRYESGERSPDSSYLDSLQEIGVDVSYVLAGRKKSAEDALEEEYSELGRAFSQVLGISINDLLLACATVHQKMKGHHPDENNLHGTFPRYLARIRNEYLNTTEDLLAKSPMVILDDYILVELIEKLEFVLDTRKLSLSPHKKAQAVMQLYKAIRAVGGKRVELKMVEAAIKAAL